MTLTHWITILLGVAGMCLTYFLARKRGDTKKIEVYFTPSKLKRRAKNKFFFVKGRTIPAVGVVNFLTLPASKHKRICLHIYLTVENLSRHAVEDAAIVLSYPRKYFDEQDNSFFEPSGKGSKRSFHYTFLDDDMMQVVYTFPLLHPLGKYQIIHPIIFSVQDCFADLLADSPLFFDVTGRGFMFDYFSYIVSAKNLSKPIKSGFWVINTIDLPYKKFFSREKKFLDAITREHKLERYIFEHRTINVYKEGKVKKDVLVVPSQKLNVSYCHFPRLKAPNLPTFNFQESKEDTFE